MLAAVIPLLAACSGHPPGAAPSQAPRLLALDPLDSPSPQSEIISLTFSPTAPSAWFGVELLDLSSELDLELRLDIDLWPDMGAGGDAGGDWDLTITANPAGGVDFQTELKGWPGPRLQVVDWNDALDIVRFTFDPWPQFKEAPFLIRVSTWEPGANSPTDVLGPVASDARENRKADLLLAFWNSYAATTPAEALRRWDGAHSGPAGERFGLRYLLQAVDEFSIPITLLDLNYPENLTGLEYLGHLEQIRLLHGSGLLTLPQTLPGQAFLGGLDPMYLERLTSSRRDISHAFGVPTSAWLSLIQTELSSDLLSMLFRVGIRGLLSTSLPSIDAHAVFSAGGLNLLALPQTETALSLPHDGGLDLTWRKILFQAALDNQPGRFTVLGGSLEDTFWGDPVIVRQLFAWLEARPWVEVHNLEALARSAIPSKTLRIPGNDTSAATNARLELAGRDGIGDNPIGNVALDLSVRSRSDPNCSEAGDALSEAACKPFDQDMLEGLKALAGGTARMLAFASRWAQETACIDVRPTESSFVDVDGDGVEEAVLTNDRLMAVIDPQGGRLVGLFGCKYGFPATMLITPRATAAIGMSDPSTWRLDRGEIGEWTTPLLQGGFTSYQDADLLFPLERTSTGVVATQPQAEYQLTYVLDQADLQVSITSATTSTKTFELPFNPSPEKLRQPRFLDDLVLERQPAGVELGSRSGLRLAIDLNASTWRVDSFLDSNAPAMRSEDPNEEAAPGHFLPFPFTLLTFELEPGLSITVHIRLID